MTRFPQNLRLDRNRFEVGLTKLQILIDIMIDRILGAVLKVIGTVLVLDVVLQIAARYLPFEVSWTDEIARLLFVWFSMLSMALTYAKNQHLCIDYLYLKCNIKSQIVFDYISIILVLITSLIFTYTGIQVVGVISRQKSSILHMSMSYFYAAVPVGFAIVALFNIFTLVDKFVKNKKLIGNSQLSSNTEGEIKS